MLSDLLTRVLKREKRITGSAPNTTRMDLPLKAKLVYLIKNNKHKGHNMESKRIRSKQHRSNPLNVRKASPKQKTNPKFTLPSL